MALSFFVVLGRIQFFFGLTFVLLWLAICPVRLGSRGSNGRFVPTAAGHQVSLGPKSGTSKAKMPENHQPETLERVMPFNSLKITHSPST